MADLPYKVKAMTTHNYDDSYTVFINSRLCCESQREGYMHELNHIMKKDYDKADVNEIEFYTHEKNRPYSQ
jgi:hypothetical protein